MRVKELHTSARNGMAGPRGATGQWCKRMGLPGWGCFVHGHGQSLKQSIAKLIYMLQRRSGARTETESHVTWEHQESMANISLFSCNSQEWIWTGNFFKLSSVVGLQLLWLQREKLLATEAVEKSYTTYFFSYQHICISNFGGVKMYAYIEDNIVVQFTTFLQTCIFAKK